MWERDVMRDSDVEAWNLREICLCTMQLRIWKSSAARVLLDRPWRIVRDGLEMTHHDGRLVSLDECGEMTKGN